MSTTTHQAAAAALAAAARHSLLAFHQLLPLRLGQACERIGAIGARLLGLNLRATVERALPEGCMPFASALAVHCSENPKAP